MEERRSGRRSFRFPERRTGFDRRGWRGFVERYRDRPEAILVVLAAVVALNLADYLLTLRALARGATEANPVMAMLFEVDPTLAGIFKMGVSVGLVGLIWATRRFRRILQISLVTLACISAVIGYHIVMVAVGA